MTRIDRRNLLRLLGLAGASVTAASLIRPNFARAGATAVPKRLVFFFTEQGTRRVRNDDGSIITDWTPTVANAPAARSISAPWSTSDFTLGVTHQALLPYQKQLTFLDGLDMISANIDPTGPANAHIDGETHALIGANRRSASVAGGPSIDQFIAQRLTGTLLPSLEMLVSSDAFPYEAPSGGEGAPLYSGPGMPLPIEGNPKTIFTRMYPNGVDASAPAQAQAALQNAQQKSVLDFAANDFTSLASRLGKLDADRLSAHAAAIKDLESRLTLGASTACTPPTANVIDGVKGVPRGFASYAAHADVFLQLTQVALACNLAPVVTLCVPQAPDELFGYQPGMLSTTDFHDMVHQTSGDKTVPLAADAKAIATVQAYHSYNATLFAKLLALLDSTPDQNGTTLLDNTLVVWCGQISGGDHSLDNIPYLLAGKLGGAVNPGRYVRMPRTPDKALWPQYSNGPAHNDLFVSLANMMGVTATTFGNPAACKGALAGWA